MKAMIAPGQPCIERFRATMPATYVVPAWLSRDPAGFLAIELRSAEHPDFNACLTGAIRAARIPVDLAAPVEVPLTFDFSQPR